MLRRMDRRVAQPFAYDVVVIELGTDGPGQMAEFAYIQPDITVMSAISPEHMANFANMDAVAYEDGGCGVFSEIVGQCSGRGAGISLTWTMLATVLIGAAEYRAARVGDSGIVGQKVKVQQLLVRNLI